MAGRINKQLSRAADLFRLSTTPHPNDNCEKNKDDDQQSEERVYFGVHGTF